MNDTLKILVVEDDIQVQEFMCSILSLEGCENDSSYNGTDALESLEKKEYDLVFLDLEIPEIHGLDVLSKLKALNPTSKAVILTGYASKESAIRALKEGAYDFIEKPFSIHEIARIVKNVKEEKSLERENDRLLKELKQTKNFLENIHSNIGAGIIVCSEDGCIVSHNNQALQIWESNEESLIGNNIHELSNDKKFENLFSKMKSGLLLSIYKEQYILNKLEHSPKYILLTVSPLIEENFKGFICLIDDITNTFKLKEKLFLSEEKYKNLVERANDGIFRLDVDGKFLFANKKITDITGLTQRSLLKKHFHDLVNQKNRSQFHEKLLSLKEEENIKRFKIELENKKKETIWIDLNLVPVRENGNITGYEGIARDITESKLMEHRKNELEQLNLNILRGISSPHFLIDKKFSIIHHNEYASKLSFIKSKLTGMNFFKVMPTPFKKNLYESFQRIFQGSLKNVKIRIGFEQELDTVFEKVFEVNGYPYSTYPNEVNGVFVIVEDITFQYKSERKMLQADKLATIGKLASGVVHEIRNPLNIMRGVVQYIQETQSSNEQISGFLNILKDEINRVTLFLEDFLNLTKQRKVQLSKIDINQLLDSVLKFIIHEISIHKIKLTKIYNQKTLYAFVDENQIRQVILNIIKNGIDAIGNRRKRDLSIRTGIIHDLNTRGKIYIEIEDTGYGTTQKVASKIFEPFFSTKQSGSGLGLAICSEILKNHNGSISFDSVLRKGSKVKIILPSYEDFKEQTKESSMIDK